MYRSKVFVSLILLLYILFAVFEFSGKSVIADVLYLLMAPMITIMYALYIKKKNTLFFLFLLFYSGSNLMEGLIQMVSPEADSMLVEFDYFAGNLLYILAYLFLVIKICSTLCALHVLKNFKINLVVLTILNIYMVYVLQAIVVPFLKMNNDYYLELIYNVVLLLLLSVALLNYFYRDNKKSLYLFIGVLCIVFSEVIQIAYFYISERSLLSFISVTLNLAAFHFLYQQAKLLNKANDKENYAAVE